VLSAQLVPAAALEKAVHKCYATGYNLSVKIRNFTHKGLKRLYVDGIVKGVPPDTMDKLRKMFAYLDDMKDPEELRAVTVWKVHTLTGDRRGVWSLSVTRNRRLTFRIDTAEREICDVNLEDYH
jgi:proteic killer suppression protein